MKPYVVDLGAVFGTRHPLYVALEYRNPSGSIKDRPVLYILLSAMERGELREGDVAVEVTSGNTGIALAFWAGVLGLRARIYIPRGMSSERKTMMRLLGADVVEVESFQEGIERAREDDGFYLGQFERLENPLSYRDLALEFKRRKIRYFVAGAGTGGTLTGMKLFLPGVKAVAVFPAERNHGIQGIGDGIVGSFWRGADIVEYVTTEEARRWMRTLWRKGFLVGRSSGANLAVALRYADKGPTGTVFPDSWDRYLSLEITSATSQPP